MGLKESMWYPVLKYGEITAGRDEEKAEMLAKSFVKIHSSDNISEEGKREREARIAKNEELVQHEEETNELLNKPFTQSHLLNRALKKTKMSAPGKDQIQYIMINNLSERSKEILLELYV